MRTANEDDMVKIVAFEAVLRSLENRIDEFGVESMEIAGAFLLLTGSVFTKTSTRVPKNPAQFDALTDGGEAYLSPIQLMWQMFGDWSLTEEHLWQIGSAFAFALPTWSKTNPRVADSAVHALRFLALHYIDVGGPAKWEAFCGRLLDILKTRLGHQHRSVVLVLGDMGSNYAAVGRFDNANSCLKEALTVCESDPDLRTSLAPRLLSDSAAIAIARGELVMARIYIDQAMEILEQGPKTNKLDLLQTLVCSARISLEMGDVDGLAQVSLRAERVAQEVWDHYPFDTLQFTMRLIKYNEDLGRLDHAEKLIRWLSKNVKIRSTELGMDILEVLRQSLIATGTMPADLEEVMSRIATLRDGPVSK